MHNLKHEFMKYKREIFGLIALFAVLLLQFMKMNFKIIISYNFSINPLRIFNHSSIELSIFIYRTLGTDQYLL